MQCAYFAVDSGVIVSGSRFITGPTLVRTGTESGEYRLIGVFTLSGPKDVEHFLGTEIDTMTRISRLRTIDGI